MRAKKPPPSAYERAVRMLASRRQTAGRLREKLLGKGYAPTEVDEAIDRLVELGYLDDHATAIDWARELAHHGADSRRGALQKLLRRGVEPHMADEALEEVWSEELEEQQAQRALAKKLYARPDTDLEDPDQWQRAYQALLRKGFAPPLIQRVLEGWRDREP